MIELINQDYADFVNLSTNLVGLDQSIDNELAQPLRNYRDQVRDTSDKHTYCHLKVVLCSTTLLHKLENLQINLMLCPLKLNTA